MSTVGNILNPASLSSEVKNQKLYQSKCMKHTVMPLEVTHGRLFPPKLVKKEKFTRRAQYLRNQDICGKNFNIVSHIEVSHWPSDVMERNNKRTCHPSQTSLDVINTQGRLINRKFDH